MHVAVVSEFSLPRPSPCDRLGHSFCPVLELHVQHLYARLIISPCFDDLGAF